MMIWSLTSVVMGLGLVWGLCFGLWSESAGGGSLFIWFLCSVVVRSKSWLGLELVTAGVEVSMLWSLSSVVVGFGLVLCVPGVYLGVLLRLMFVLGVVCLL